MSLHDDIMNIRDNVDAAKLSQELGTHLGTLRLPLAYRIGHRDARHAAAELAMRPAPVPDWRECERISDIPDVDEALQGFNDDATGDNATMIVRAVLTAYLKGTP